MRRIAAAAPVVVLLMSMPAAGQGVPRTQHFTFLYEYVHTSRSVYLDTPHPKGPIEW
jgi:hypothetical protein